MLNHRAIWMAITMPLLLEGCASLPPTPACRPDPRVANVAQDWFLKRPQDNLAIPPDAAICFRNQLVDRLSERFGPVIGYKVGLYTKAGQSRFGATEPNVGLLLRGMMLEEGRPVSVSFAYSPLIEADLLLVVKDDGINSAETKEALFRHIRGYRPFIELPDNNVSPTAKMSVGEFIALNDNARAGIAGREVPLPQTAAAMDALRNLEVEMTIEGTGPTVRQNARALDTLADPLEVALFAKNALLREGRRLRRGDLISLGAILPARAPRAGETVAVHYHLAGASAQVEAEFIP